MARLISPDEALSLVTARVRRCWNQVVAGASWEPDFRLSPQALTGPALKAAWPATHRTIMEWDDWLRAAGDGVERTDRVARFDRIDLTVPAVLTVATIDAAARLAGPEWVERLSRGRARRDVLAARFPGLEDTAALLRLTDGYADQDFELACRAGAWFAGNAGHALTARQVPVEGMGTKWLASHQSVVRRLAGLDDLGLLPGRPPRVHLTYLDADHLRAGGRRHDVATVGDIDAVAYRPRVVLVSENRDTAQLFPPVRGGIAIEGDGNGPGAVPLLDWVRDAEVRWYWGDMDADGLEILHGFRAAGLDVRSLFMDMAAYERWEAYGVDHDHAGNALGPRAPRELPELAPAERRLYDALCSPEWPRHRRVEQERIPLAAAAAVVVGAVSG